MSQVEIIPGIFESEWAEVEKRVALAAAVSPWIHVDIADGSMIDRVTPLDGAQFAALIAQYPHTKFEAHLFVANPEKYLRAFVDAGFIRLTIHLESNDPRRFLEAARYEEIEVGIAIDGATEIGEVEPFLEEVDLVTVMTKEAGATGGNESFLPESIEKVKLIREHFPDLPIEAVGGITDQTVKAVKDAGATRIVSTEYIFSHPGGVEAAIEALRSR